MLLKLTVNLTTYESPNGPNVATNLFSECKNIDLRLKFSIKQ